METEINKSHIGSKVIVLSANAPYRHEMYERDAVLIKLSRDGQMATVEYNRTSEQIFRGRPASRAKVSISRLRLD